MACINKAWLETPRGKEVIEVFEKTLSGKRLTVEKLWTLHRAITTITEHIPPALYNLQTSLHPIIIKNALSSADYFEALMLIQRTLPPIFRTKFGLVHGTNEKGHPIYDYARDKEVLSLIDPPSETQIQYIERLGGKVSQFLNGVEASQLIQELLKDDWRVERASKIYAAEKPASEGQLIRIERLGGTLSKRATELQASEYIDRLEKDSWRVRRLENNPYPPTFRQRMVFRFWNVPLVSSKEEASAWTDNFYQKDPNRTKEGQVRSWPSSSAQRGTSSAQRGTGQILGGVVSF